MIEVFFSFILGAISCSTAYYVYSSYKLKRGFKNQLLEHNKLGEHVNHMITNMNNQLSSIKSQDNSQIPYNDIMPEMIKEIKELDNKISTQFKILAEMTHKLEDIEAKHNNEIVYIRKELERYGV